jgi:hypothetical protein
MVPVAVAQLGCVIVGALTVSGEHPPPQLFNVILAVVVNNGQPPAAAIV